MNVASPPDEPVARHPHNASHAGRRSGYPAPAGAGGEHRADYLLRLLTQIRQRSDNRVERYRRVGVIVDTSGNVEYAATFRRLRSLEDEDGLILDEMIENVQRQFSPRAPA
jgi:hypothetical protein